MADTIQVDVAVSYTKTDLQQTTRFLSQSVSHVPVSYESGEFTLIGSMIDYEIATNVNMFLMVAESAVKIKVGNTTNPEFNSMKMFTYDGATSSFFLTNPSTDPIKVKYVSSKF